MKEPTPDSELLLQTQLLQIAEGLTSADPITRDQSIEMLPEIKGFQNSPLIAYILISRLIEPDLEIRFHLVQALGMLLDFESSDTCFSDDVLENVHYELRNLDRIRLVNLLEVGSRYLSAEKDISNVLKVCSYAGEGLSGIVNDRKQPVRIRQQAAFYCGKLGFLESRSTLESLVRRVEKARESTKRIKSRDDEEQIFAYAVAAISKFDS